MHELRDMQEAFPPEKGFIHNVGDTIVDEICKGRGEMVVIWLMAGEV